MNQSLEKKSVLLTVGLAIVTLGIYPSVWFLNRFEAINSLVPDFPKRIFKKTVVVALGASILSTIAAIAESFLEGSLNEYSPAFIANLIGRFFGTTSAICLIVLVFKTIDILREHVKKIQKSDIGFSKFIGFFLGIFYLQAKINKLLKEN